MEYFDILDSNGKKTGASAQRGSLLQTDQFYLGVHIYLYNSSHDFLIQKRAAQKDFRPSQWDLNMGHVISGETSDMAACREINEELGFIIHPCELKYINRYVWYEKNHMIDVFFCMIKNERDQIVFNKDEVEDIKFISSVNMIDFMKKMNYRPYDYRKMIINEIQKME